MSRVRAYFLEVSMGQLDLVPTIQSVPVTETTLGQGRGLLWRGRGGAGAHSGS